MACAAEQRAQPGRSRMYARPVQRPFCLREPLISQWQFWKKESNANHSCIECSWYASRPLAHVPCSSYPLPTLLVNGLHVHSPPRQYLAICTSDERARVSKLSVRAEFSGIRGVKTEINQLSRCRLPCVTLFSPSATKRKTYQR